MPLSRYQVRNEYSLADPQLYTAADKDDPEALLEGIAMAGLVGVLRQLGDLAEFAAEIFHDLHEQVMATASRGHSLTVRVQQLEAEFPSIEKAFLSQTIHSSFYYNAGTDWHPNLRMDENLITQGDLPRFIMDSYEECRGPPRLFLLDKFDVAGAGACLKRYTDPSFFKVETSYSDVIRDKKTRKAKKKGSRWRHGETPETLPTSHAKLHQLFLEERAENGTLSSAGRVKLKRRLNGFPFDTKSGKSYMEKFLKPPSPNHDEVHEIPEDLSLLALPSNGYESTVEVVEISTVSPEEKSRQRTSSSNLSPAREDTTLELVMDEQNEVPSGEGSVEVSKPKLGFQTFEISSTSHRVSSEKDIPIDAGMKIEGSMDENQSDDVASEIDNYVDALTTMDSEVDTDSEFRTKNDAHYLNNRERASDVDANDVQVQAHSSDWLSGNSTLSDDGSNSSKKDVSSFSYSDTHSTSAECVPLDSEVSSNALTSSEIHEAEPSPIQQSVDEERQLSQPTENTVSDGAFVEAIEISNHCFELGDPNTSSSPGDSAVIYENAEAVKKDTALADIEKDDMVALSVDLPFVPSVVDVCQQKGDYLPPKTSGEILDEFEDDAIKSEKIVFTSGHSVAALSKYDFPLLVSSEKQSVDESEDEDGNVNSIKECLIVPCTVDENLSSFSPEIGPLNELLDGDKSLSAANDCLTFLQDGDKVSPTISLENLSIDNFGVEGSNYVLDAFVDVSNIVETAAKREIAENVMEDVPQISHREDDSIQNSVELIVGSQNSVLPLPKDQLSVPINEELETHCSGEEFDERAFEVDNSTPSDGERAENFILKVDSPAICETVESCDLGTKADVQLLAPAKEQTLYLTKEYCDQPSNIGDGAVVDKPSNIGYGAVVDKTASYADFIETRTTAGTSLLAEVHTDLNEGEYEIVTGGAAVAGHDDELSNIDDDFSFVDLKKLQEGSLCGFGDEHCGLEYETHFLNKPEETNVSEDGLQKKFTSPDVNDLQDTVSDDDLGPRICDRGRYLPSGADCGLNLTDAPSTQSSEQQYEQDPHCLEEHIGFQSKQLGVNLLGKCDDNSGWLTKLQEEHVPNHDDHLGTFDTSSESVLKNISSQSSAPEQLSLSNNKVDVSGHYLDLSKSTSSTFSSFPDSGQIYVEEMPPLPPLPPVQWRMGKFQNASPAHERVIEPHNSTAFPSPFSSSINKEAQDSNLFLPHAAFTYEKPAHPLSEQPICNGSSFLSQIPSMVHHGDPKGNALPSERFQVTGTPLQLSGSQGEMLQNDFEGGEEEKVEPSLDAFCHASKMDATKSLKLSHEGFAKPVNQMVSETSLRDLEHQHSAHSEKNIAIRDTTEISVRIADEDEIPSIEGNLLQPTAEENGSRTVKLPRRRNPLIDAVVALDKSKLRKVAELAKPQIQKEDERDSLLEQIRSKSFNLKPAAVTRPSIQGPKTNLKVAAILEKAKTIRQAFAGSDEDEDDDGWSDS